MKDSRDKYRSNDFLGMKIATLGGVAAAIFFIVEIYTKSHFVRVLCAISVLLGFSGFIVHAFIKMKKYADKKSKENNLDNF